MQNMFSKSGEHQIRFKKEKEKQRVVSKIDGH